MSLYLNFFKNQDLKHSSVELREALTIGRSPDSNVVLDHDSVSRLHATVTVEHQDGTVTVFLCDANSTNGSIVNGRLIKGESVRIRPGDSILIGIFRIDLVEREAQCTTQPGDLGRVQGVLELPLLVHGAEGPSSSFEPGAFLHEIRALGGEALLDAAARTIRDRFSFDVLYMVVEPEAGFPRVLCWDRGGPCRPEDVSVSRALVSRAVRESLAILAGTMTGDEEAASPRSIICAPIRGRERTVGSIYMASRPSDGYSEDQLRALAFLASILGWKITVEEESEDPKEDRELIEAILANLPDAVLLTDERLRILAGNAKAFELFGGDQFLDQPLVDTLAKIDPAVNRKSLATRSCFTIRNTADAASDGVSLDDGEPGDGEPGDGEPGDGEPGDGEPGDGEPGDGETPPAESARVYSATWGTNPAFTPGGWKHVLCLHDVSHEKRIDRMKLRFIHQLAGRMVHPLTVLTSTHSLLAEQLRRLEDPQLADMLQDTLSHAELCARQLRRFLDFTARSCNEHSANSTWTTFPIEDLVAAGVRECRELIAQKKFRVRNLCEPGVVEVEGEREKLVLIFQQLIDNAVRFGRPEGSLVITAAPTGDRLRVAFLDDGPGVPLSEDGTLPQIHRTVDPHRRRALPGLGVGLWLVGEAVQYHHGRMTVTSPASEDQTGTLVQVVLPGTTREHDGAEQTATNLQSAGR